MEMSNRESKFELLRIVSMFGIVLLHAYGQFYGNARGVNLFSGVLINSVFNVGVSLFAIISGYFGIKLSGRKLFNLWSQVLIYSVMSVILKGLLLQTLSIKEFIRACFPVSSGAYWYVTAYVLLLLFSKYINLVIENMGKQELERLLLLLFTVFSVVPTIIQIHVMQHGGKGLSNVLLMYMIGRYIRLYAKQSYQKRKLIVAYVVFLTLEFSLNYILSLLKGGVGVYAPFARDCSILIVILAVITFLLFREFKVESRIINVVSKHTLAVYLFEGTIRCVLEQFLDLKIYATKWYLVGILVLYTIAVMIIAIGIEVLRVLIISPILNQMYFFLNRGYKRYMCKVSNMLQMIKTNRNH